jgi:hypothetical protein
MSHLANRLILSFRAAPGLESNLRLPTPSRLCLPKYSRAPSRPTRSLRHILPIGNAHVSRPMSSSASGSACRSRGARSLRCPPNAPSRQILNEERGLRRRGWSLLAHGRRCGSQGAYAEEVVAGYNRRMMNPPTVVTTEPNSRSGRASGLGGRPIGGWAASWWPKSANAPSICYCSVSAMMHHTIDLLQGPCQILGPRVVLPGRLHRVRETHHRDLTTIPVRGPLLNCPHLRLLSRSTDLDGRPRFRPTGCIRNRSVAAP